MSSDRAGSVVACGWAGRALAGTSGDLHVVAPFPEGALVALIDGLGHGPEAAAASIAAAAILADHAGEAVAPLLRRCHEGLRRTRGAVMTITSFDSRTSSMTGVGVGNVEAIVLRSADVPRRPAAAVTLRAGVVGFQLPPLHVSTFAVSPGDTLVMATDGVREAFAAHVPLDLAPQEIAEALLARFARGTDDAHVLVARYVGAPA